MSDIPSTTSGIPATSPVAAVVSDSPPKSVTPSEAIPVAPAAALEPLTQTDGTFLEKAKETIFPIVEKVQTTTKPYTDAAAVKVEEIVHKIEGTAPATQAREIDPATGMPTTAPSTSEKAAGTAMNVFGQISSVVSSTFTQVTNTIETRTTTGSHPGLITQVQNAVAKGQHKLEAFLDQPIGAADPSTAHPIQTTTNSVPHTADVKADPLGGSNKSVLAPHADTAGVVL